MQTEINNLVDNRNILQFWNGPKSIKNDHQSKKSSDKENVSIDYVLNHFRKLYSEIN